MSRTVKIWLIIAAVLIALGMLSFAALMAANDWDISKLSTVKYVTNAHEINGEFEKISINVETADIKLALTDENVCRVVCYETEKARHFVTVQSDTLVIDVVDTRKWYDHIGLFWGEPTVTLYLPRDKYVSLLIDTDTGDVDIPKEFSFEVVKIDGDTSDVTCLASASDIVEIDVSTGDISIENITVGKLIMETSTGDIDVTSVTVNGSVELDTDTGETNFVNVSCAELTAKSDTGDIILNSVTATGDFLIESDTGDVNFKNCDAAQISVKTRTGDVSGTLLTDKVFFTQTSTGDVSVPQTTSGGRCDISTSTGDVTLSIKQ